MSEPWCTTEVCPSINSKEKTPCASVKCFWEIDLMFPLGAFSIHNFSLCKGWWGMEAQLLIFIYLDIHHTNNVQFVTESFYWFRSCLRISWSSSQSLSKWFESLIRLIFLSSAHWLNNPSGEWPTGAEDCPWIKTFHVFVAHKAVVWLEKLSNVHELYGLF